MCCWFDVYPVHHSKFPPCQWSAKCHDMYLFRHLTRNRKCRTHGGIREKDQDHWSRIHPLDTNTMMTKTTVQIVLNSDCLLIHSYIFFLVRCGLWKNPNWESINTRLRSNTQVRTERQISGLDWSTDCLVRLELLTPRGDGWDFLALRHADGCRERILMSKCHLI